MLNDLTVPRWINQVIEDIDQCPFANIELVILNVEPVAPKASLLKRLFGANSEFSKEAFWIYTRIDDRINAESIDFQRPTQTGDLLASISCLSVVPLRRRFVHRFEDDDIRSIRSYNLDVILRFGFNILKGDILQSAKFGIWSYHHDDNREYRGGPAMFWELWDQNPITGTILQILNENLDGGDVIYRSYAGTAQTMWLSRARQCPYWKASTFVIRSLRHTYQNGSPTISESAETVPYTKKIYRTPTNGQMLSFLLNSAGRSVAARARNRLMSNDWYIAYRVNPKLPLAESNILDIAEFSEVEAPDGHYYADPCVIDREEASHIFFEDFDERSGKGAISHICIDDRGQCSKPRTVLEADYHQSYPFVFEWQDEVYMVPESAGNRAVKLYKAKRFPHDWEYVVDLLTGCAAVDATIFEHEKLWYLFANISERGGALHDELFLFFAETPLGPWQPHPLNPVKSDVRSARPAGRLFWHKGRLIRPAQDCSGTYGRRLVLCVVDKLTPDIYRERAVSPINTSSDSSITGLHTLSATEKIEVIDYRRRKWKWGRLQ